MAIRPILRKNLDSRFPIFEETSRSQFLHHFLVYWSQPPLWPSHLSVTSTFTELFWDGRKFEVFYRPRTLYEERFKFSDVSVLFTGEVGVRVDPVQVLPHPPPRPRRKWGRGGYINQVKGKARLGP